MFGAWCSPSHLTLSVFVCAASGGVNGLVRDFAEVVVFVGDFGEEDVELVRKVPFLWCERW